MFLNGKYYRAKPDFPPKNQDFSIRVSLSCTLVEWQGRHGDTQSMCLEVSLLSAENNIKFFSGKAKKDTFVIIE